MSIRLKFFLFISFLFLTAIGNAVLTFQLEKYGEEKLQWVIHTHEVIIETKNFLSKIQDAETGQRGYLLTKNNSYLEPYQVSIINIKYHLETLEKRTSDNPVQQKRLESIKKFMQLKLDELNKTIMLAHENNYAKALEIVNQNKGKDYMDNIRSVFNDFVNTENLLLEQRKGDYREHRARLTTVIYVEIMFFIFLGFMTFSFLNRQLFSSLKILLSSTEKMERGEKIDISDVLPKDEMGYLLSAFFKMNEKVHHRTQTLDYKAHHDELTGLENRTKMYDKIQKAINNITQSGTKIAVLFIDLNKFKYLNDTYGHNTGDLILKETALRLKDSVRIDDYVFRIGGDEFLVMLKNLKDSSQVQTIVSNILKAFNTPAMIQGRELEILLSIGIAVSPDDTENSDEILKFSDIAMYEAKNDKNAKYKFFDRSMLKRDSDI